MHYLPKRDIPMTKELVNYKTWTEEDISNRQEKFSKLSLKIWNKIL